MLQIEEPNGSNLAKDIASSYRTRPWNQYPIHRPSSNYFSQAVTSGFFQVENWHSV